MNRSPFRFRTGSKPLRPGVGREAVIQCLASSQVRPRADSEDPSRSVMPVEDVSVFVEDKRRAEVPPSLGEEGFTLLSHRSPFADFDDVERVERLYLPDIETLVAAETGASFAWALPRPVVRRAGVRGETRSRVVNDGIAPVAHVDYSPAALDALAEAAAGRRGRAAPAWHRLVLYTAWRAISPPPQDWPLAICDVRTVGPQDLVPADAIANAGALSYSAEFLMLRKSPRHRWGYFPDMVAEEVLLFRQLDSACDGPSGCPHVSFAAPSAAASPRVSIEVRICAFFD